MHSSDLLSISSKNTSIVSLNNFFLSTCYKSDADVVIITETLSRLSIRSF